MVSKSKKINPWLAVWAVSLGYFVDLYDLFIFTTVRLKSLEELGVADNLSGVYATSLLNYTVLGMVMGGILWGIIADKKGRLLVLFLSIIVYSIATGLNAFVQDITFYKLLRFIAGIGIAGELGTGITLVTEQLDRRKRTWATMIISAVGMLGAVTAGIMANITDGISILGFSGWRFAFLFGSALGLCLLIFRLSIRESEMFVRTKQTIHTNFFVLLKNKERVLKFLFCILPGMPVYFIIGVLLALSKELAETMGIFGIKPSNAIILAYICISLSDLLGNWLSKKMESRKKILYITAIFQAFASFVYLYVPSANQTDFYIRCALLGASIGFGWAVLVTNAAEQFGTNFRATVANSVPNFVRGLLMPLTLFMFEPLINLGVSKINSAGIVLLFCVTIALFSISKLKDQFEVDADFIEEK